MTIVYSGHPDAWGGLYHRLFHRLHATGLPMEIRWHTGPVSDVLAATEVLITTSQRIDVRSITAMPGLRLIQQAGSGVEGIDRMAAAQRGIAVANVPTSESGAARAVAEHALGLMLALLRQHRDFTSSIAGGVPGTPVSSSLFGKTVGIIGFGSIGRQLASLLLPFEVPVLAIAGTPLPHEIESHVRWIRPPQDLHYLLGESDVIVLACSLNPSTRHLIDRAALKKVRRGAVLINVARGALLDTESVLAALNDGTLSALGIDVFEREPIDPTEPLLLHSNVLASPHVAAATENVLESTASIVVANILRVAANEPPLFMVRS